MGSLSSQTDDCALCRALGRDTCLADSFPRPENTPLMVTEQFVVIPCIGPLAIGHVMVVSRKHFPSLAAMGPNAVREYDTIVAAVKGMDAYQGTNLLEAEHGATESDSGGACVSHTHLQLIPAFRKSATGHNHRLCQLSANSARTRNRVVRCSKDLRPEPNAMPVIDSNAPSAGVVAIASQSRCRERDGYGCI